MGGCRAVSLALSSYGALSNSGVDFAPSCISNSGGACVVVSNWRFISAFRLAKPDRTMNVGAPSQACPLTWSGRFAAVGNVRSKGVIADVRLGALRHQSLSAHKVGLTVLEQSISIPQWLARFQNGNATHQNQIELAMKEGNRAGYCEGLIQLSRVHSNAWKTLLRRGSLKIFRIRRRKQKISHCQKQHRVRCTV
jgi:hypothetical protein